MSQIWNIQLLGCLRASNGEKVVERFLTQKTATLLAYLALNKHQSHTREEVVDVLWPESDYKTMRGKLNHALWAIRRDLGEELLITGRQTIEINDSAFTTDVAEFETCLQTARRLEDPTLKRNHLHKAIDLYKGDLLPSLYDDWVLVKRRLLADRYLLSLQEMLQLCEQSGDAIQAIEYAQKLLDIDDLQEEIHIALMRLYLEINQPSASRRQYETLKEILADQLDSQASEEAQRLYKQACSKNGNENANTPTDKPEPVKEQSEPELQPKRAHIPTPLTEFFGREKELDLVEQLLNSRRLVTLVGAGGTGKTRLSIECAKRLTASFTGGIWFVSLADLRDSKRIPEVLVRSLKAKSNPSLTHLEIAVDNLLQHSDTGEILIIFDNFEQLSRSGAHIIRKLMDQVSNLRCLVTSRHRLRLQGEQEVALGPLDIPEDTSQCTPSELLRLPSIQLFVDRAKAVRIQFHLSKENADAVAKVCRRLEGFPLAIELAAALSHALSPKQMLGQLNRRFELLVSRYEDVPKRHHSLRAAIDSSYALLTKPLQELFGSLSVFHGGWTAEAAYAVCAKKNTSLQESLEHLLELCERSLIVSEEVHGGMRYRMLETLREYAEECIEPEKLAVLEEKHANYYSDLADSSGIENSNVLLEKWANVFTPETENIRKSLRWLLDHNKNLQAGEMAIRLHSFWADRQMLLEGRGYLHELIERIDDPEIPDNVRSVLYIALGDTYWRTGENSTAKEYTSKGLELREKLGNLSNICDTQLILANIEFRGNELEQAENRFKWLLDNASNLPEAESFRSMGAGLLGLGNITCARGNLKDGNSYYKQSLEYMYRTGNKMDLAATLANIAYTELELGNFDEAERALSEAWHYQSEFRDLSVQLRCMVLRASVARYRKDYKKSETLLKETLELNLTNGDKDVLIEVLNEFGALRVEQEMYEAAVLYYAMGTGVKKAVSLNNQEETYPQIVEALKELKKKLGSKLYDAIWTRGVNIPVDETIEVIRGNAPEVIPLSV